MFGVSSMMSYVLHSMLTLEQENKEMLVEFNKRKDDAAKRYWDATQFPRKKKKEIRKKAKADYLFYSMLVEDKHFSW